MVNSVREGWMQVSKIIKNRLLSLAGSIYIIGKFIINDNNGRSWNNLMVLKKGYSALFEEIENGFALHKMIFDKNGKSIDYRFVNINAIFEKITGLKRLDVIGKTVKEVLPNIEQIWIDRYGEVVKTGNSITFENYSQDLQKYYEVKAYCPNKGYFAVLFTDITKYKEQELVLKEKIEENAKIQEKLTREKYLLDTLMQNASEYIYFKDFNSKFIACSRSLANSFGYESADVIGKSDFDFFDNEHAIPAFNYEQQIIKTGIPIIGIVEKEIRKDGSLSWVSTTKLPLKDIKGNIIGTFGISKDITRDLINKQKIAVSEHQLFSIFENSPVIMMLLDENCHVVRINKKGLGISNIKIDEAVGKRNGDIFGCIEALSSSDGCGMGLNCNQCVIRNTILNTLNLEKDYKNVEVSWTIRQNNKDINSTLLIYTSLLKIDGIKYILFSAEDITSMKNYENEIMIKNAHLALQNEELKVAKERAEQSDKLKSAFLANISHEIRTPMNSIIGFSEILLMNNLIEETKSKYINIINQSCEQLLTVVNDILDISRLESGELQISEEYVVINDLIADIYWYFKPKVDEKKLQFFFCCPLSKELSKIRTDRKRLQQIMANLIHNALKFTQTGLIKIGYELTDNQMIQLFVEDTGIGIEYEKQDIVFERFMQANSKIPVSYGGTGLGLSISKKITELLGGKISIKSIPNQGSTFYITFPYIDLSGFESIADVKFESDDIGLDVLKNKTILVAEDEYDNYLYFEELLSAGKVKLIHANNGKEAIELCESHPEIDLILMDIKMPVLNGYEAMREIKKKKPLLPIIAQTAYAMDVDRKKAMEEGFSDYISKPIKMGKLISILKKYLT